MNVIALGFFDGVHLGHGALLRRTAEVARETGLTPAVFTFDRSPKAVVTGRPIPLINSAQDRKGIVERYYGIEKMIVAPFDHRMMTMPWQSFITDFLVDEHKAAHVVAGHDFHFGHKNEGTPARLQETCARIGIGCDIIPRVEIDGATVSSTYIRQLIEAGDMARAVRFLGHPHILTDTVRHGRGIGRSELFPTANLLLPQDVIVPSHGVYATRAVLPDGTSLPAVTNVGVRPTVNNGSDVTVEASLIGFSGDLYGSTLRIEFYEKLRGERRFSTVEALKAQIQQDIDATSAYFSTHS